MNRLRRLEDPLLAATFTVLWICTLVPLWMPRFLPLLDIPNHLGAIAIWHRLSDPSWGYDRFYCLNLLPVPYWGHYFPVHLLAYLFPIETANRVYLSAYSLALPLGAVRLAGRMGRSPWLGLFAFPLVFNINFALGFISFCAGVAVLLFDVEVLDRFLEAPTVALAAALGLLTLLLYSMHLLPWMVFGIAAPLLFLCHGWHPRRIAAATALMLPSVALALCGYVVAGRSSTIVLPGRPAFSGSFEPPLEAMRAIPMRLIAGWVSDDGAYKLLVTLAVVWLAILLTARTDSRDTPVRRHGFPLRLELILLVPLAGYFLLPNHLYKPFDLWMVSGRLMAVVALLGVLLPRGGLAGRRKLLLLPLVAVCIYYPLALARHWQRFNRRAQPFVEIIRKVPRGSSTITLMIGDNSDPDADGQSVPFIEFHAYSQLLAGGFDPWAEESGFPMAIKPGAQLPAPLWSNPAAFNIIAHGLGYDYVLTRGEPFDYSVIALRHRAPLIATVGDWRLYRVIKGPS